MLPRHICTRRTPTGLCGSLKSYAWQCIVPAAADVEEQVQRPADGQRRRQLHHAHDPGLLPVFHQLVRRWRHKHLWRQHLPAISKRWGQKTRTAVTGILSKLRGSFSGWRAPRPFPGSLCCCGVACASASCSGRTLKSSTCPRGSPRSRSLCFTSLQALVRKKQGTRLVANGSLSFAGKRAPAEIRHKQAGVQHEAHSVVDGLRSMSCILKHKGRG